MRHYVNLKSCVNDHVNIFRKKCQKYEFLGIPHFCQVNTQNSEKWTCFFSSSKTIFTFTEILRSICFELNNAWIVLETLRALGLAIVMGSCFKKQ